MLPQDSPDFEWLFREGTRLLHAGQAEQARRHLEQAYTLQPDHADAALNLSGALILTRQFRRAVRLLEELVELEPENPMIWTNLGAAYLGNPVLADERSQLLAIEAFKRALELDPLAPNAAYNIGLIYRDRKEHRPAIHWLRRAVQANPADRDARRIIRQLQQEKDSGEAGSSAKQTRKD